MALKLQNEKQIIRELRITQQRIERALVFNLEAAIANLQNHAKKSGDYNDQTSNLRGSIGGVVLKNGKPIAYRGFDDYGAEGNSTGLEFLNSLLEEYKKGYTILVVAGMEYAAYVEDYHGLNVLKKTELKMRKDIPKTLDRIKKKIAKLK